MSGTITLASSMGVVNGNFSSQPKSWGKEVVQNTTDPAALQAKGTFNVTQAAEVTLPVGSVSSRGWIRILNLSADNFIRWGFATGVYGGRILPGEEIQIRLDLAQDVFMIADTADAPIEYEVNAD